MVLGRSLVPGRSLDPVGHPSREHRSRASFRLLALLAVGALLGPAAAAAFELPPSQPGVYVYDFAHVWQPATVEQAQATVAAIRERTGAEIAIVSVPTGLSSVSTEMARVDARTIMDTWGVGRAGVNDGLVILFDLDTSLRHGQIYLYTGSGFRDGYLSDDEVQAIVDNDMLPKAKEGDLDGALLAGLAGVDRAVQPGGNPARATKAILDLLLGGVIVGTALLVLGLFLRTWWLRGRDAQVPLIDDSVLLPEPPRRLTPALATVLRNDGVDRDAFTTALVDLGHRGLITFRERDSFLGLNKRVDLVVPHRPLDDFASEDARRRPLGAPEQNLLRTITTHKGSDGVLSSERLKKGLGKSFYDTFRRQLGRAAQDSGWFRDDPTKLTSRWAYIGIGLAVAAGLAFFFLVVDQPGRGFLVLPLFGAGLVAGAIIVLSRFLAARTADGAQTLAMALAYRNTLRHEMASSDTIDRAVQKTSSRLPWITTPDELTVWAVALGLNDEIDRLIKQTFAAAPQGGDGAWAPAWFAGSGGIASVGDVSGMIGSISTTSASSSGGGYGGGGGGGDGGGGGGGGGGGF